MKANLMFGISDTLEENLETILEELARLDDYASYWTEDDDDYIETMNEIYRLDNLANDLENLIDEANKKIEEA